MILGLLPRRRAAALAASLAALVAYCAVAPRLPEIRSSFDVVVQAALVLPLFAGAIWLALPLARTRTLVLLALAARRRRGRTRVRPARSGLRRERRQARLLRARRLLLPHALRGAVVDRSRGRARARGWTSGRSRPARRSTSSSSVRGSSIASPSPCPASTTPRTLSIGPPDVLFFALFLAAADRFRLRVAATWIAMTRLPRRHARARLGVA